MIKDKLIIYIEEQQSKVAKYKIDFNSPRTAEVAAKAGISFKDCVKR